MGWVITVLMLAIGAIAGFVVGVAYGQEHWNE